MALIILCLSWNIREAECNENCLRYFCEEVAAGLPVSCCTVLSASHYFTDCLVTVERTFRFLS